MSQNNRHFDVAVVGAGIVGLAHAWMAAKRGLHVLLLDRSALAEGASVRNFGMIWPIGQPAGYLHTLALRSRELWLELGSHNVLPIEPCGSIHLAHRLDELSVLEEFSDSKTHDVQMLSAREVAQRSSLANTDGLMGGLFSSTELRVDPRIASARIAGWLANVHGIECCFRTLVTDIDHRTICASDGRRWQADRIIVCSGSDLQTLYPETLASSGLVLCKLQMLKSTLQPITPHPVPHLASGLTLRHYMTFRDCPSWKQLHARIETETPELNKFGIHVMASQCSNGEVILGDSHEYGDKITPFDKFEVDELILREAHKVFRLTSWTMSQRWNGVYAKHPDLPVFEAVAEDGACICVGTGGAGMTMSFALAERAWSRWLGEST